MADALEKHASLYEEDFYAWTVDQAAKLRARAHNSIDWDNAAEEIESVGNTERNEIESRLGILLAHLLKWRYQPTQRSNSWKATITEQRSRIARRIRQSPSLRLFPSEVLGEEYPLARLSAIGETNLAEETCPAECPYTIEQILDPEFYPEAS